MVVDCRSLQSSPPEGICRISYGRATRPRSIERQRLRSAASAHCRGALPKARTESAHGHASEQLTNPVCRKTAPTGSAANHRELGGTNRKHQRSTLWPIVVLIHFLSSDRGRLPKCAVAKSALALKRFEKRDELRTTSPAAKSAWSSSACGMFVGLQTFRQALCAPASALKTTMRAGRQLSTDDRQCIQIDLGNGNAFVFI